MAPGDNRGSSAEPTIECADFDVRAIVNHVIDLWQRQGDGNHRRLQAHIDAGIAPRRQGDSTHLTQVLFSLVNRSLQLTRDGDVTLRVQIGSPSDVVRFAVEHTGGGMHTTNSLDDGAGLGLAMCRRLVALMGGDIDVASEPNGGTRFAFQLHLPQAAECQYSAANTNAGRREPRPLTGHVLVVDDNDANRHAALTLLERLGLRAEAVADGQQALRAVHARRYDLVLMDCQMPVFDGYEASAAIRFWEAGEGRVNMPIIALTASASGEERERCAVAGMNDCLRKPLNAQNVRRVLERWLPTAAATASSAAPRDPQIELSRTGIMHIDRDQFQEMRLLLGEGFADFVRQFHVNVHDGVAALRAAVDAHDAPALKRAAHRLKGTAGTLGLSLLAKQCAQLEAMGRAGDLDTATVEIERLQLTYRQLCRALEKVA